MTTGLAALSIAVVDGSAAPMAPATADLIITNAHIETMDRVRPQAEAVAVRGGQIVAVGTPAETAKLQGPATRRIDAHGHTLVPGFIDTHMHPRPAIDEMSPYGVLDMSAEGGIRNKADFFAKINAKAQRLPVGALLVGTGYGDDILGGHPTLAELDAAAPAHPVIIFHSSGHRLVANSAAFVKAGVTRLTPDPVGGKVEKDVSGGFSGAVLETAMAPFARLTGQPPSPGAIPEAIVAEGYRQEFRTFLSYGLTGIADAGITPAKAERYRALMREGLPVTVYAMLLADHLDWLIAEHAKPEWTVPGLTMRTVKIYAGNSLSGHTAWLHQPYADDPQYFGLEPKLKPPALLALVRKAQAAGLQVAAHANGDREIDQVLDAYATIGTEMPRGDTRHRIEHASITNAAIIARTKALNVCFAPHSYILNHGAKLTAFGAARFDWIEPNRRAIDAGICIGGTSDHPVSPPRVMERIQSLVTRRAASNGKVYGPAQRLTVDEALYAYTMGSAYLQFEEKERGSISVGKRADFVILSDDPSRVAPEKISAITVLTTIIGGKTMFELVNGKPRYFW
ncbi:MAG: amidohydrolase [Sphingomonas sp.]